MRSLLALLLLAMVGVGLTPYIQQAMAYTAAHVDLPSGQPAVYTVTATNGLVACSVPSRIKLRNGNLLTAPFFQCTNNFGSAITLNWSAVPATGDFIAVSSSDTLTAGSSTCRTVTIQAGTTNDTRLVTFVGTTAAAADFFAEIYFAGEVQVQQGAGGLGGGCP